MNYKSNLQQVAQREYGETPTYLLLDEKGPGSFEVLQDFGADRRAAVCSGLGPQQEGSRAAGRLERALPACGRTASLSSRTDEAAVNSSLVTDLGLSPEVWLFLSLLGCVTLFFKFSRFWSVRNLDLLLLFVLAPGMMLLVGNRDRQPWSCLYLAVYRVGLVADSLLGRPGSGAPPAPGAESECLGVTVSLAGGAGPAPGRDGQPARRGRSGAQPGRALGTRGPIGRRRRAIPSPARQVIPRSSRSRSAAAAARQELPQVIVVAGAGQPGPPGAWFSGLLGIGWRHFERPLTGMAMAACYLLLPYTRMAVVDSGQLIPAALIVAAVFWHHRPALAGALIGLAAGWIPACLGLIALWCGFYRGRGAVRFTRRGRRGGRRLARSWATGCRSWATGPRALGARSIAEVGLFPQFEPRSTGSFWVSIDPSFRLPVLIAYLALVIVHHVLARRQEPGRADRALGRPARRQPVLVSRQGRYAGDALPSAGDRDDVSADPHDPQAAVAGAPAPGQPAFALSFFLIIALDAATTESRQDPSGASLSMSFVLTYDAIAKRIDHSLLGPALTTAELEEGCRLAVAVRRGQRVHQALRRRAGRADPQGFGRGRRDDHRVPARWSRHGGEGL